MEITMYDTLLQLPLFQGLTQGGVSRIISFAVCGIWDTPGSPYPIGHPGSQAAYKAYKAFLNEN